MKEGDVFFPDKVARSYLTITSQKAVEEMGLEEYQKRPIGTGPFMLEEGGVPGEKYCTVKFDDYWGQKAKLDRVEYYVIPDDVTLANAMEAGEIDTYDVNNLEKVEEYMADPDTYVLLNARDSAQSYIGINANFEPLNDPKVREAIALSIDRDMVCISKARKKNPKDSFQPSAAMHWKTTGTRNIIRRRQNSCLQKPDTRMVLPSTCMLLMIR